MKTTIQRAIRLLKRAKVFIEVGVRDDVLIQDITHFLDGRDHIPPEFDINPIAYEWHNVDTGHCYVDYIPHNLMDENNGYIKTPLFKSHPQSKEEQPEISDEKIQKQAYEEYKGWSYRNFASSRFIEGAKWMREQLNK